MGALVLLLLGLALGAPELPTLPDPRPPPAPVEGECARAWDLAVGRELPAALVKVENGRAFAACTATALPLSTSAHALQIAMVEYPTATRLHDLHVHQLGVERDYWQARAIEAERPIPWHQRPAAQQTIGSAKGVLATALAVAVLRASVEVRR